MRREGSKSEFGEQRDRELYAAFRRILVQAEGIPLAEMFGMAAKCAASRFWVGEHRATDVISVMLRGGDISGMYPEKQRMYREILRRVREMRKERSDAALYHLVFEAVNQPAPEFYLTAKTVKVLVYQWRRKMIMRRRAADLIARKKRGGKAGEEVSNG